MPKKKSVKKCAQEFQTRAQGVVRFAKAATDVLGDEHTSWAYDYAIIRLYREFESLMLDALVGAFNNDTAKVSETLAVKFPKHLEDEVCKFLVTGPGYFDFKGRADLIKQLKTFVPENHYLVTAVKKEAYKQSLDQLCALRNFAAHGSEKSKRTARRATAQDRIGSSGSWLKVQNRFPRIVGHLKRLATEIESHAPY
jgi:cupin superfamily acireductone dioxygenase involved in methionine salvage